MAVIKLAGFTGEAPRVTPRLLPASGAQIAQSVRLEDGELGPFRKPFPVEELAGAVAGTVKTIYLHGEDWLHWTTIVHAAPGPVAADRLYYTGDGVPKMRASGTVYDLAVPAPSAAPTATPSGVGSGDIKTRLYAYTFVTSFGEESEPSPISNEVSWQSGQIVTLSGMQAAPAGRGITLQRIYRAQTSASGTTQLYFVAERAASNANYVDNVAAEDFNEPLPSTDWNPPPAGLSGLVSLPNGMMAGFVGKDLYFSEPYRPHAWPEKYVLTTDYDIVALAAYGTTMVVGTAGNPYLVSGSAPEVMVMEKLELNMPCLSPQGMIDLGYAVAYPSHDGLVVVQGGAANVATASLLTRDQWLKMDPETFVCGQFYGRFFASYAYTDMDGQDKAGTIILDLTGASPFLIRSQHKAEAMFYDVTSGALFMAMDTTVYEWDSRQAVNDVFTWRSKSFVLPAPTNFGAILFEVDQTSDIDAVLAFENALADTLADNAALFASGAIGGELNGSLVNLYDLNGDALTPLPAGPSVSVNIYADGKFFATVSHAGRMQRLPGGKLAREWEIEVTGNMNVIELTMATTGQELRSV